MMMCDENIKMKLDDDDDSATLPRLPIDQPLNDTASISLNAPFAANPTCSSTLGARRVREALSYWQLQMDFHVALRTPQLVSNKLKHNNKSESSIIIIDEMSKEKKEFVVQRRTMDFLPSLSHYAFQQ